MTRQMCQMAFFCHALVRRCSSVNITSISSIPLSPPPVTCVERQMVCWTPPNVTGVTYVTTCYPHVRDWQNIGNQGLAPQSTDDYQLQILTEDFPSSSVSLTRCGERPESRGWVGVDLCLHLFWYWSGDRPGWHVSPVRRINNTQSMSHSQTAIRK